MINITVSRKIMTFNGKNAFFQIWTFEETMVSKTESSDKNILHLNFEIH